MTFKYRWQREISPPAEWFDLDRSEKMIQNLESYRPKDPELEEKRMYPPCPECGAGSVIFRKLIRSRWFQLFAGYKCAACNHLFVEREKDNTN